MELDGKKQQKSRWRFGANHRHASPVRTKSSSAAPQSTWNTARSIGKAFRRSKSRKSSPAVQSPKNEYQTIDPTRSIRIVTVLSGKEPTTHTTGDAKLLKRSMTMPAKLAGDDDIPIKAVTRKMSSKESPKESTFVLKVQGVQESSTSDDDSYPAYEVVPKAKSMVPPTSSPLWPKTLSLRKRGKLRGNLRIKRSLPPAIQEEKSLDMEEMVGFECIDTFSTEHRTASRRQGTRVPHRSRSSRTIPTTETRQDSFNKASSDEMRETSSGSDVVSVNPSIEVSMSKGRTFASRTSKSTQHFSVSTSGSSHVMGKVNRFFPSFMHLGRNSSIFDITVYEDEVYENDTATYWTEATSRQKSRSGRSLHGSYSSRSSYCSSSDDSSYDSSFEEEDDDSETYSLASNSTISTRASEINQRWEATVDFNGSILDAERRKYD